MPAAAPLDSTAPYRRLAYCAARLRIRRIVLAACTGGAELCAEDERREGPAQQKRERRRSELGAPAFIGTSWSLIETRHEGEFLSGVLVNPRGGVLPGRVFVIANEWDCG